MSRYDNMDNVVVVKVGGSLLTWPKLAESLEAFLDDEAGRGSRVVLIAGGGPAADLVGEVDSSRGLGDETAHRLALRAMDFTAELLAALLPGARVATRLDELPALWREDRPPILAPRVYLEEVDELRPDRLPFSWSVTSDSIAARVAETLGAERLVLFKSASAREGATREEVARAGLVDSFFPEATRALERVEVVNLRESPRESRALAR